MRGSKARRGRVRPRSTRRLNSLKQQRDMTKGTHNPYELFRRIRRPRRVTTQGQLELALVALRRHSFAIILTLVERDCIFGVHHPLYLYDAGSRSHWTRESMAFLCSFHLRKLSRRASWLALKVATEVMRGICLTDFLGSFLLSYRAS